jgi:beta-lactamase superfamily II metal-dependent hydrolase
VKTITIMFVFVFVLLMPLITWAAPAEVQVGFAQLLWLEVQPILLTFISAVLMTAAPVLLWKLNEWAKAKVHDARFHCAMDKLTTHAERAVLDVGQTYVKAVKREGQWGGAAAQEAKGMARSRLLAMLGPGGLKELKGCLGQDEEGLQQLISGAIEAAVVAAKSMYGKVEVKMQAPLQPPGVSEK